jgi:hypothetical protein
VTNSTKRAVVAVVGVLTLTTVAAVAAVHWWTIAMRPSSDIAFSQALATARSRAFGIQTQFQAAHVSNGAAMKLARSLVAGADVSPSDQTNVFASQQGPDIYSLSFALEAHGTAEDTFSGGQDWVETRLCLKLSWHHSASDATLDDTTCPAALRPFGQGGPVTNTISISRLRG